MHRRTNLKRNTPLQRKPMKRKKRRGDKPEIRHAHLELHSNCALCHAGWREFDNPLAVHHLVGGSGRADVAANLLTLCRSCHEAYHSTTHIDPGVLLTCKLESDPEHFDLSVILKLLGRQALPERWELKPIPTQFLEMRNKR